MIEASEKQRIGRLGEDIAAKYLENKGFKILDRNYRKKCGEIDLVAQKGGIIHFVEVKSVSCENIAKNWQFSDGVSCETDQYRPEDNIHPQKLKRLSRAIQVYLLGKYQKEDPEWIFDAITARIDVKNRNALVRFLENIIL